MQFMHSYLWENDIHKFEATIKLLNRMGGQIKKLGSFNLPKLIKISPFIMGFRVLPSF